MDNTELLLLWQRYDEKLDRIENINKKLIYKLISPKTSFKINFLKFQSAFQLLIPPLVFSVAITPTFYMVSKDILAVSGFVLVSLIMAFMFYEGIRYCKLFFNIHLDSDTIVETKRKMVAIRIDMLRSIKKGYLSFAIMMAGLLMLIHKGLHFSNSKQMGFIILLLIAVPLWGKFINRVYMNKHNKTERELDELKEYE